MLNLGFSDKGALYNPSHFAASLPDDVPIVLVFGAQAVEGLRLEDHPYVRSCFTCFLLCLLDLYFCDLCSFAVLFVYLAHLLRRSSISLFSVLLLSSVLIIHFLLL